MGMDFIKAKTSSWLRNVSGKFEDLCDGVGSSVVAMEVLENRIQTAQTTFKNLCTEFAEEMCSEFAEELLPFFSSVCGALDPSLDQASDTMHLTDQEGSDNEGYSEGGDLDENLPSEAATDELLVDTPLAPQSDDTDLSSPVSTDDLLVNGPLQQSDDDLATEEMSSIVSQKLPKKLNTEAENDLIEEKNLSPVSPKLVSPAPSDSLAEESDGSPAYVSAGPLAEDDHATELDTEIIQPNDKELDDKIVFSSSVLEAKIGPYLEYIWDAILASNLNLMEKEQHDREEADYQLIEEEDETLAPLLVAQDVKLSGQDSSDSDWEII